MKKPFPLLLCLPFAFIPCASAGTIIVSVLNSGQLNGTTYNLDQLGALDWKIFSPVTTGDEVKAGGSGISDLTASMASFTSSTSSNNPRFSWTGGTPTASATSFDPNFLFSPLQETTGDSFSITAAATDTMRTFYVFVGTNRAGTSLTASLSDGSATPVITNWNPGSNSFDHRTYKIDFMADAASGETLNVTFEKTQHNSQTSSAIKFQGAALVPEPSAALLSVAGLGLAVFRRRR